MSVTIREIDGRSIEINGKLVIKNMDGSWVCRFTELTPVESKALYEYLKAQELRLDKRMN